MGIECFHMYSIYTINLHRGTLEKVELPRSLQWFPYSECGRQRKTFTLHGYCFWPISHKTSTGRSNCKLEVALNRKRKTKKLTLYYCKSPYRAPRVIRTDKNYLRWGILTFWQEINCSFHNADCACDR